MPTLEIPSYNSRQNVRPIQQAPLKNGESLQGFKDVEMVLSTGQKIVADLQKAENVMQETQAKTDFKMATARIQQQAFEDGDFDSADKYKKAIEQAKKEALGKISNGQVRTQVGMEFEYDVQATMLKVENDFYKKRIANNEVVFTNATQQMLANKVLLDKNSEEYKRSELEYARMVQAQKESGLLSDEQIKKIDADSNKNVAENLVYTDPAKARAMIEDGVFNLDPKEKHRLIEDSYNVEKASKNREEYLRKQEKIAVLNGLSEKLINNELDPLEIRELQRSEVLDVEDASIFYAASLKKEFEIPEGTQTADADYFLRLLDDAGGDKTIRKEVFADAAKLYSNNKMGKNQYRFFVQEARKTIERQDKGTFLQRLGGFFSSIKNATKAVKTDKEKSQVIEDISESLLGKDPEDVVEVNNAVLKALSKHNPSYRVFIGKNVGDIVTLPNGTSVKYNGISDGDVDIEVIK